MQWMTWLALLCWVIHKLLGFKSKRISFWKYFKSAKENVTYYYSVHQKFCEHGENTKICQKIEELKTNQMQKESIDLDLWFKVMNGQSSGQNLELNRK